MKSQTREEKQTPSRPKITRWFLHMYSGAFVTAAIKVTAQSKRKNLQTEKRAASTVQMFCVFFFCHFFTVRVPSSRVLSLQLTSKATAERQDAGRRVAPPLPPIRTQLDLEITTLSKSSSKIIHILVSRGKRWLELALALSPRRSHPRSGTGREAPGNGA